MPATMAAGGPAGRTSALGRPAVAVRSSATAEDAAGGVVRRAAGHLPRTWSASTTCVAAVERCWASLWTASGRWPTAPGTAATDGLGLAVVVQRMVDADASGVLFTADPVTGDESAVTINATWGLGEAVVGGEVTPDVFTVAGAAAAGMVRRAESGSGRTRPCPTGQAERLAALGVRIEALDRQPVDVEWCRVGDELFVLQARPITAGAGEPRPLERQPVRRLPVDQHQRRRGDPGRDDPGDLVDGAGVPVRRDGHGVGAALPRLRPDRRPDLPQRQCDDEPVRRGRGERADASAP